MFGVIEWLCIAESNNCLTIPALQKLIEVGVPMNPFLNILPTNKLAN